MSQLEPEVLIPFAEQLATMAGEIIRKYYGEAIPYNVKEDDSPVTKADKEVERSLRALIKSTYPDHGVIGEEYEPVNEDAECVWMIDPIDGTKSFMIGRPIFGTLISLLINREPVLGILDQPILGERWTGVKGYATNFNSRDIQVRPCESLQRAVLCTTSPNLFKGNDRDAFERVREASHYTVYGGDCYSYGLVAKGSVDLVIETELQPFDFCALRPIIEGARGIMTDWNGKPVTADSNGKVIVSGDKRVHEQVLEMVNA